MHSTWVHIVAVTGAESVISPYPWVSFKDQRPWHPAGVPKKTHPWSTMTSPSKAGDGGVGHLPDGH